MSRATNGDALRCSFCNESIDSVQKLISSPSPDPGRAYICEGCVAVCAAIVEDDCAPDSGTHADSEESHSKLGQPLTPLLLAAIERWIIQESVGTDAVEELAEVRAIARRWMLSATAEDRSRG